MIPGGRKMSMLGINSVQLLKKLNCVNVSWLNLNLELCTNFVIVQLGDEITVFSSHFRCPS